MTISKFWQLEIKSFFRMPQWEVAVIAKIFLGLFALYMFVSLLAFGVGIYYILEKVFPEQSTLMLINQGVFYVLIIEILLRYFFQQPPTTRVQTWILLPIRKSQIIHLQLLRSILNPLNITPLFLYLPIAVVCAVEGTPWMQVLIWFFHLLFLTLTLNFLIFLADKSKGFFISMLIFVAIGIGLEIYTSVSFSTAFAKGMMWIQQYPLSLLCSSGLLVLTYSRCFHFLKTRFYLDMGLSKKPEKVLLLNFAFLGGYGKAGALLINDLRLLLRNARTKQVLLISIMLLFYGLIFFPSEIYKNNSLMLIFASVFITGGFSFSYGQQVSSWDSEYFSLLMTQNLTYREYLNSKWWLMAASVLISMILASFYLIFGWKAWATVVAGAFYNMGVGTYVNLYSGAYHRVPVKLNVKAKAFENTKALNTTQLLFTLPKLGLPLLLFFVADFFIGGYAGWITLVGIGLLGLLLKKPLLDHLAKIYIHQKHKTVEAFSKN